MFDDEHIGIILMLLVLEIFFFFNDTATTEIYTLSLHDALPICARNLRPSSAAFHPPRKLRIWPNRVDRKSTRLNSSHVRISYAVFCLKKKNTGAGYFLDAVAKLLPSHAYAFYGVEKFPPPPPYR